MFIRDRSTAEGRSTASRYVYNDELTLHMGYRARSVSHTVSFRKLLTCFAPQFVASRLCEREKELTAEAARLGLNSHRARHFAGSVVAVALLSMQKAMPSQLLFPKLPCPASPCRKDTPVTPIRKRFVTPYIPG